MIPTLLNNRYQVVQSLSGGGYSHTFLAEDTHLPSNRRCVIKQLKPLSTDPDTYRIIQERFQREAAVLEALGKQNDQIPELYASFTENGQFYMVEEWVEGKTLTQIVRERGAFSENEVRDLLVHLLPVLEFIHTQRIIHRDIKPDNIIIRNRDGKPVLIDFGVVKEVIDVDALGNPTSTIMIGTKGFMPLEQAAGKPVYASDIYGLGMTSICLLTARTPQHLTDPETGEMVWYRYAPHLTPTFAHILKRSTEQLPRDRFSSAREMLEALTPGTGTAAMRTTASHSVFDPKTLPTTVTNSNMASFPFVTATVDQNAVITRSPETHGSVFQEEIVDGLDVELVAIAGNTFLMGTDDFGIERVTQEYERYGIKSPGVVKQLRSETPQHYVTVAPFMMSRYQITQAQWRMVASFPRVNLDLNPDPSFFKGDDRPVEQVSWEDAIEFCARLTRRTGRSYRLPSEAEWEYACRAGTTSPFAFGETITTDLVNYDGNFPYGNAPKGLERRQTIFVGSLGFANAFGLSDMHGNVWEWCLDVWHFNYIRAPEDGAAWTAGGDPQYRVVRGGSWNSFGYLCRSGLRFRNSPVNRYNNLGFRIVLDFGQIPTRW